MARDMRNVTVTLDEETVRWAKVEAARRDVSLSSMIRQLLRDEMRRDAGYEAARERYFAQAARVHRRPGEALPSRDEIHGEGRYQR